MKKFAAILLAILVVFSFTGCAKQNGAALTGTIEADKTDVCSEISGKVTKMNFNEGDTLKNEDIVSTIDTESLEIQKKQAEAQIASVNYKYQDLKSGSRQEQLNAAKASINQINAQIDGQKNILNTLNDSQSKLQSSIDSTPDIAKKQELNQSMDELKVKIETSKSTIDSLNAQKDSAEAQYKLLQEGSTKNAVQSASSSVDQAQASLDLINLQIDKSSVKAQTNGVVIYKLANEGQFVNAGTPLYTTADMNNLWVKFYIPEKELGKIKLGQSIKLKLDDGSSKTYDGKITFISSEGEFTPKNVETKDEGSKVYFAFKVKITSGVSELKPGMMIDAVID